MTSRFAAPELLDLGPPPPLAGESFDVLLDRARAKLIEELNGAGVTFEVARLDANPAMRVSRVGVWRDQLRRQEIDDAVAQTFLGSATGAMLDARAADYGVLRRVVQFADPVNNLPEILEDDVSLRLRARLAWEALSVAGPAGAYVFHAVDAHPEVCDAVAYGPESGFVQPGEVLVVIQSRSGNGVASDGIIDTVAARLDAYEVVYGNGTSVLRPARDRQSVRPLGARVTVASAQPLTYTTTATLFVSASADREALRIAALDRLNAYQETRRRIGVEVPNSGRVAALHLVGTNGLPIVDEVHVVEPDVMPNHRQIPIPGAVDLTMVVR